MGRFGWPLRGLSGTKALSMIDRCLVNLPSKKPNAKARLMNGNEPEQ